MAEEAEACPGCGGALAEVTDPAREDRYRAEAIACHYCAARDLAVRRAARNDATVTDGLLWRVIPI